MEVRMKTLLLTIIGFLFLGMGAIGLLLPVWPTTPFILAAVACFSSAPRIRARIMRISFFREHIENYENRTGLSHKTVWISLVWLWGMMLLSMVLMQNLWISLLLIFIGAAVTSHILLMARAKSRKKDKKE